MIYAMVFSINRQQKRTLRRRQSYSHMCYRLYGKCGAMKHIKNSAHKKRGGENIIHFWRHEKTGTDQKCPYSDNLHAIKSRLFLHPFTSLLKDKVILARHKLVVKQEIAIALCMRVFFLHRYQNCSTIALQGGGCNET